MKRGVLTRLFELLVRSGVLVASGDHSTLWCEEHQQYCPPVWYRPAGRSARRRPIEPLPRRPLVDRVAKRVITDLGRRCDDEDA